MRNFARNAHRRLPRLEPLDFVSDKLSVNRPVNPTHTLGIWTHTENYDKPIILYAHNEC